MLISVNVWSNERVYHIIVKKSQKVAESSDVILPRALFPFLAMFLYLNMPLFSFPLSTYLTTTYLSTCLPLFLSTYHCPTYLLISTHIHVCVCQSLLLVITILFFQGIFFKDVSSAPTLKSSFASPLKSVKRMEQVISIDISVILDIYGHRLTKAGWCVKQIIERNTEKC